jgi:hypothetical protein
VYTGVITRICLIDFQVSSFKVMVDRSTLWCHDFLDLRIRAIVPHLNADFIERAQNEHGNPPCSEPQTPARQVIVLVLIIRRTSKRSPAINFNGENMVTWTTGEEEAFSYAEAPSAEEVARRAAFGESVCTCARGRRQATAA